MELLSSFRVLDLSDEKGSLAGRILADLGADVLKLEPPGGDPCRRRGPFPKDEPDPEKSLSWLACNLNKRGLTLNLASGRGREILARLVKTADVVIESFPPGFLARLGLGYDDLCRIKPEVILTSVTPFGQSGPYRDFKASDLTLWNLGGMAYVSGDPDRAPLRISQPQAYLQGGAAAAGGAMIAAYHREITGVGQWVDVSILEAVVHTLMNVAPFWDVNRVILKRAGSFRTGLSTAANQRLIWPCKDGHINFPIIGGSHGSRTNWALMDWMEEEGMGDEYLRTINWDEFDMAKAAQEEFDRLEVPISRFFASHTMEEMYQGAVSRRMMLYPVYTVKNLREDPQLAYREFWTEVYQANLGRSLKVPGSALVVNGQRPALKPAPGPGEHNREIYVGELGLDPAELVELKAGGVI